MSVLRLLSVIHGPVFGGAHNQAVRLREPLERLGVETVAVLPREAEMTAGRMRESGLETITTPLQRLRAVPNPVVQGKFLAALGPDVARLRGLIRDREIDVVQVHGITNPQGAIASRLERSSAVVWQLFDTRAPPSIRRLGSPLFLWLADATTVWGRELARGHPGAERLGERLITVFPPVDPTEFEPDERTRLAARRELGVPPDSTVIGTIGVRNPQKGHEDFVRAAAIVKHSRPNAVFRVLGAPSPVHAAHMAAVEAEARELGLAEARDLAFVDPGTRVCELMHALDVFVLSSVPRSEGIPTVILEAMGAGKPVVTTDVGAVRELVEDGRNGLVVKPRCPSAIANAILRLIEDRSLSAAVAKEGRRQAVEQYGIDELARRHRRAYELAIEYRRSRTGT